MKAILYEPLDLRKKRKEKKRGKIQQESVKAGVLHKHMIIFL
jgi:hypothetical protein